MSCTSLQGWSAKVVTAVSLPDLESHVSAMNVLRCDAFALRCVLDVIDLLSSQLTFCRLFFKL